VEAASRLSVVVRRGPFMAAVNGTLVARPAMMMLGAGRAVGSSLTVRARPRSLVTAASWQEPRGLVAAESGT
jgi:hypothetical protein